MKFLAFIPLFLSQILAQKAEKSLEEKLDNVQSKVRNLRNGINIGNKLKGRIEDISEKTMEKYLVESQLEMKMEKLWEMYMEMKGDQVAEQYELLAGVCDDSFGTLEQWANFVVTSNDQDIPSLYKKNDASLLATSSNEFKTEFYSINAYFEDFFDKTFGKIASVEFNEKNCQEISAEAVNWWGHYSVHMIDGSVIHARFTFLLGKYPSDWHGKVAWLIVHHHSSYFPEQDAYPFTA